MKLTITIEVETNLPEDVIDSLQTTLSYEFDRIFKDLDENENNGLKEDNCESDVTSVTVVKE